MAKFLLELCPAKLIAELQRKLWQHKAIVRIKQNKRKFLIF